MPSKEESYNKTVNVFISNPEESISTEAKKWPAHDSGLINGKSPFEKF